MKKLIVFYTLFLLLLTGSALAQFNFGTGGACNANGGTGTFNQSIAKDAVTDVGVIPIGVIGLQISLRSTQDIDIQLFDDATNIAIVRWPNGLMAGGGTQSINYSAMQIGWSGYNGDGTNSGKGNEWITVNKVTTPLRMKVFGYSAGVAAVTYQWTGVSCPTSVNASGHGSFNQAIALRQFVSVGQIPVGVSNLSVELQAAADIDIRLVDLETGTAVVSDSGGLLSGSDVASVNYRNMTISYSGYNGDGSGLGNEYIRIEGATTSKLELRAYGYQAGSAVVNYAWDSSVKRQKWFNLLRSARYADIVLFSSCPPNTTAFSCASYVLPTGAFGVDYGFYRHAALVTGVRSDRLMVVHAHPIDNGVRVVAYGLPRIDTFPALNLSATVSLYRSSSTRKSEAVSFALSKVGAGYGLAPTQYSCAKLVRDALMSIGVPIQVTGVFGFPVTVPDDFASSNQLTLINSVEIPIGQ